MAKGKPKKEALRNIHVSKYDDNEWSFEYPRLSFKIIENLDITIDISDSGRFRDAEKRYKDLIRQFPEFIDAYHHLLLLQQKYQENNTGNQRNQNLVLLHAAEQMRRIIFGE